MKKQIAGILLLCLALGLCGCQGQGASTQGGTELERLMGSATVIQLEGGSASVKGPGASFQEGRVVISTGGTYLISGSLDNGQILVDTGEEKQDVKLILDAVDIRCEAEPGIYIQRAGDTSIYVLDTAGSRIVSGTGQELAAPALDASGGAIYAKDDIEFMGPGTLVVEGYLNNGVGCKNDVDVSGGTLDIKAANNGLKGNESVNISGGQVIIECLNDGIKTSDAEKAGKGSVNISGGNVFISRAGDQGIVSIRDINISGGTVNISAARDGLKAGDKENAGAVNLSGGQVLVSSGNDAIDANAGLNLSGGRLLALGKDKDLKTAVNASVPCYAGPLRAEAGQCLVICAGDQRLLEQEAQNPWEVKSAFIAFPEMEAGASYTVKTGQNMESLKESGSFTAAG